MHIWSFYTVELKQCNSGMPCQNTSGDAANKVHDGILAAAVFCGPWNDNIVLCLLFFSVFKF